MPNYPGSLPALVTTRVTGNTIPASDHNDTAGEVNAIGTELGTNAKGAAASVRARMEALESGRALKANLALHAKDYGAIWDGAPHPLSERYATLAAAQVDYSFATALTQQIDWAAVRKAQLALPASGGEVRLPGGAGDFGTDLIAVQSRQHFYGEGGGFIGSPARGVTTVISSRDGNVFEVPIQAYAWGIGRMTVNGARTLPSQVLLNLGPTGTGEDVVGYGGVVDDLWLINAGLDCCSGWGVLDAEWSIYVSNAKRYGFYARGGYWNANRFLNFKARECDQWGVRWSPQPTSGISGGPNKFYVPLIESNNQLANAAYGGFWLEKGSVTLDGGYFENNSPTVGTPLLIQGDVRSRLTDIDTEFAENGKIRHEGGIYTSIVPRYGQVEPQVISTAAIPPTIISPTVSSVIRNPGIDRNGVVTHLLGGGSFLGRVAGSGKRLTAANFALGAGWGSLASIQAVTGTDSAFKVKVRADGTGIAANPILTLTFAEGTWSTIPFWVASMGTGTTSVADAFTVRVGSGAATTLEIQMMGTPTALRDYEFVVMVRG